MSEPPGNNKKERVLHTRISETLDRELRSRAEELGVSVSKLVRNALSNTIDLVENIVADSARVAGSAGGATLPATREAYLGPRCCEKHVS